MSSNLVSSRIWNDLIVESTYIDNVFGSTSGAQQALGFRMENAHGCSDATNDKTGSCIRQALLAGAFGYIRRAASKITISLFKSKT